MHFEVAQLCGHIVTLVAHVGDALVLALLMLPQVERSGGGVITKVAVVSNAFKFKAFKVETKAK